VPKTLIKIIRLSSLVADEDASVGKMMVVAGGIDVFAVDAGDLVAREEVRALIEAGREVASDGLEAIKYVVGGRAYGLDDIGSGSY